MPDDVVTDALDRAVRAHAARLGRELRGAWRAGYDYLHVYHPTGPHDAETVTLATAVLPSNVETPPARDVADYRYAHTYVLAALDAADVPPRTYQE